MSIDRWIDKEGGYIYIYIYIYIYTHPINILMEFYSSIKKNEIRYHTKWSKSEKDKYHMISLICGILKTIQMNLFTIQKGPHRHRKQTCSYQRGKGGKG